MWWQTAWILHHIVSLQSRQLANLVRRGGELGQRKDLDALDSESPGGDQRG